MATSAAHPKRRDPERIGHADGEVLASRDLRDADGFETRMREIHVRALHDTWGIAIGLLVGLDSTSTRVTIGPGFAYDTCGQEIVVATETSIGAPVARPGPNEPAYVYDLICSYAAAGDMEGSGGGLSCGWAHAPDRASLRWEFAGPAVGKGLSFGTGVRLGDDVPLGRFTVAQAGTMLGPDPSVRRSARPLLRPHVGHGVMGAGAGSWHVARAGWETTVDSTAAGFSSTPCYFVSLRPNPWTLAGEVGPFVSVSAPTATSFKVRLVFGGTFTEPLIAALAKVGLSWIGLEPFTGCPPAVSFIWNPFDFFLIDFHDHP